MIRWDGVTIKAINTDSPPRRFPASTIQSALRPARLCVTLGGPQQAQGNRHIVVDSTGIKVYGEGEWKVRKHGISKRRTWRKLHLAVGAHIHDIVAVQVTTNDVGDNEVLGELLDQIDEPKGAKIWQHGHSKTARHNRDENLRSVRKKGMKKWKQDSGYQPRNLAETAMFRNGRHAPSRRFDSQCVELMIHCVAINGMTALRMPKSEPIF